MKRIFHTWDKWECYPAGFYENHPPEGMTVEEAEEVYRAFLSDVPLFKKYMGIVITTWKNSCEHYLTNTKMNRIAWMGQAAICVYKGIPSRFRGGYNLLTEEQKLAADEAALEYVNKWMIENGYEVYPDLESISSRTKANIY